MRDDKTKPNSDGPASLVTQVNESDPKYRQTLPGSRVSEALLWLDDARTLGVHVLKPGTLKWLDANRFEGEVDFLPNAKVRGRIDTTDDHGRILKLGYAWDGQPPETTCLVEYGYSRPVGETDLPNLIITVLRLGDKRDAREERLTNTLEHVEIGTAALGATGYTPDDFLTAGFAIPYLVVYSNALPYSYRDGFWVQANPPLRARYWHLLAQRWLTLLGAVGAWLLVPFVIWYAVRRRRTSPHRTATE